MIDAGAWLSGWAKSFYDREVGGVTHWLALSQHLLDSAGVARRLVEEWVPAQVVTRIGADLSGGEADVPVLAAWLAGVHDVGKLSPAFAVQVDCLADRMRGHGLVASPVLGEDPSRRSVAHSLVGHVAVRDWLAQELGLARRGVATQLASIVGSHHGIAPERSTLTAVADFPHLAGTGPWAFARAEALRYVTRLTNSQDVLLRCRDATLGSPALVLLSAIVILADWIASNTELFPLEPVSTADMVHAPDVERTARRVERAWELLDLPQRWSPALPGRDVEGAFRQRFPHIRRARPVQKAAVETALALAEPGVVVIEAPMGVGKTEAALLAAETLAARFRSGGCFIALPTQATTDAMFARVSAWLRALPQDADRAPLDVTLAHGKASLNDAFTGLVRSGRFACVGEDGNDAIMVHQWLRGSKKGTLASFVVGTIDQVLVAALKSRHLMLRHLSLAGKVVVIDEVHAYDVYMSQYLQRVLQWLGAYGVPVVLLSATLPSARRRELLCAYAEGQGRRPDTGADRVAGYPAISTSLDPRPRTVAVSDPPRVVGVDKLADDLDSLVRYLRGALAEGGCAAVVRNTVARVQETADRLAAEFGVDNVTVNHSRFLACDRARIDTALVERFGPPGPRNDRSGPHVVVASQVLEQSLDVDFDVLVTDLAPIDLILQRMGRLHRHTRVRPSPLERPRCAVVGVEDWAAEPVRAVPGSRRVYGEHLLLRSAALLVDRSALSLPDDIALLVQAAYGDDVLGPGSWQPAMHSAADSARRRARERRDKAGTFLLEEAAGTGSLIGWQQAGVGDADGPAGAAQVRDGAESLEVLVLQRDRDGGLLTPDWIGEHGGVQVPLEDVVPPPLATVIAACTLRLPFALSHEGVIDAVIAALERANHVTSFEQTPLLAGQLVLTFDAERRTTVRAGDHEFVLTYDVRRGLLHEHR